MPRFRGLPRRAMIALKTVTAHIPDHACKHDADVLVD
jgi:hypothetical protein